MADRWRALFGNEPPRAAGLVAQAVAWREQVLASGDVAPVIARDLAVAARHAAEARVRRVGSAPAPPPNAAPSSISAAEFAASATQCTKAEAPVEPVQASPALRRSAAPRTRSHPAPAPLPPASSQLLPGTRLVKSHGGRTHVVEVTGSGFVYEGAGFTSLSAVAKHITGTHWNGLLFFGLRRRKTYPPKASRHG